MYNANDVWQSMIDWALSEGVLHQHTTNGDYETVSIVDKATGETNIWHFDRLLKRIGFRE